MKKKVSGNTKSLIISLFAVLSCLTASHASAQTARVTIGMRQVKMEQVMNEIEKQTRYLFIHDKNLDTDRTVSVEVRDRPVAEALEQMVGGTGLTYEINGSNIILSERRGGVGPTPDETPQTVAGTVTDSHGLPVIGASVIIKGTTIGVSTDVNGGFELRIPSGTQAPVLLVNYLGYEPQEVAVNGRSEIAVTMQESAVAVENVVVTALGIKRQEKALSYNVQQVKAEDITTVKDANFMNSLNGKVAGVQINASAAGISGYRQFEYPFIARAEGTYEVEPVEFSYFDPARMQYMTLRSRPLELEITPDAKGGGGDAYVVQGRGMSKEEVKMLGQDIRFIKLGNAQLRPVREPFLFGAVYWVLLFGILAFFTAVYVALRKQIRESQNAALVRGKRANKVAVQRFRVAKRYMEEQNRHAFYEEMLRALWGYMGDKFNIPVANLTKENVREELHKRGVSVEESQRFTSIITKCDEAQYSPAASAQMSEVYAEGVDIISRIEAVIKR